MSSFSLVSLGFFLHTFPTTVPSVPVLILLPVLLRPLILLSSPPWIPLPFHISASPIFSQPSTTCILSTSPTLLCGAFRILLRSQVKWQFHPRLLISSIQTSQQINLSHISQSIITRSTYWSWVPLAHVPEVSSIKLCCLGVFRKEYFRLITK